MKISEQIMIFIIYPTNWFTMKNWPGHKPEKSQLTISFTDVELRTKSSDLFSKKKVVIKPLTPSLR